MSGGGGAQNTVSEFKPPARTEPGWDAYVAAGNLISQVPYKQSGMSTVAPINATQQTGMQMAIDRAMSGAPDLNAARGAAMRASTGALANPYSSDEYINKMIGNNAEQMAKAYSVGGAVQNDAAAAMQGAYGGSAHQEMKDRGETSLASAIGDMSNKVQAQQQQYKGQLHQQDVANMLSGAGLAGQLSKDDYDSIKMLMGAGNDYRSYEQQLIDAANNQWGTQNAYDSTMNEYLGNVMARASGAQGQTTVTNNGPGASPLMGLLGGGLAAYSAFKP